MAETIHDTLKKIALFSELPDDMIAQLAGKVEERNLPAGEVLFHEGDEGDTLFFILSGGVEIYHAKEGKILDRLNAGDYFGEMALVEEKPRSASARTSQETSLLRLCRPDFKELLKKNPGLAMKMANVISSRLRAFMSMDQPETAAQQESTIKVFISYSRRDKEFVQKFHNALSAVGINTWVDWENIPLTADWWNEIRLGIENADAFAFVISPDSLNSDVCAREVQTAVDNHKRLIPILHKEPQKGDPMHEKVSSHNWVYMRNDTELETNLPQMLEIVHTDLDHVRTHTRLQERALEWERAQKNASFLLQGDELQNAERWLEGAGSKKPQATPLHIEFIQASRRASNRRQRMILTASFVGLGVAVVLAIVSFAFFLRARSAEAVADKERNIALTAQVDAEVNYSIAATAQVDADNGRRIAEEQASIAATAQANAEEQYTIAVTAQAEAEEQRAEAVIQAQNAQAGELAASGFALLDTNPPLAALLALESDRLALNNKTAQDVLGLLPAFYPPLVDTFVDPAHYVAKLAWSPSGQLASASGDNSILLWNLDTHEPDKIMSGHEASVTAMAWSEDGQLATGSDDGTIILWDLQAGEPEIVLPALQGGITGLAWSPRGRLASSSGDGSVVVWDLANQREEAILYYDSSVNCLAWSPFGQLASGAADGSVATWNIQNESVDVVYNDHQAGVLTIAWSPDGALASGSRDSTIAVRNPFGTFQSPLRGHTDYVNVVDWNDEGQLASASWDSTVILWDVDKAEPQQILHGHTGSVDALDWGPNGKLASGGDFLFVWDLAQDAPITAYPGHLDWIDTVGWTPDGQLMSNSLDSTFIMWDGETQSISEQHPNWGNGLDVSSNNQILAGGYLLDRNTGEAFYLAGHDLTFSPDENFAAGNTDEFTNAFAVWDLVQLFEAGEVVSRTFFVDEGINILAVAWSPDGNSIATAQDDGSIVLWDLDTGEASTTLSGHEGAVNDLVWNEDGRLASAGDDQTIIIWNGEPFEKVKTLSGFHESRVTTIAWGPDGELASADGTGRIAIWDVEQEKPTAIVRAPYRAEVRSVAWSPDGTKLAFGGSSYNLYVYNTQYAQAPCAWLARNMTEAEWDTYYPEERYHQTCSELPSGFSILSEGVAAANDGNLETAIELFGQAEAQGLSISASDWNLLCWFGGIHNQAELVFFACENAVALEPDNGDILDSRGLARALLGDFEGAIEDFEAFVAYAQEAGFPEEAIAMREAWIEALKAGNNPFDEAMLALLRGE